MDIFRKINKTASRGGVAWQGKRNVRKLDGMALFLFQRMHGAGHTVSAAIQEMDGNQAGPPIGNCQAPREYHSMTG